MKLLLMQCAPRVGAIDANSTMILDAVGTARQQGCDVVVFPELMLTGYPPEDLLFRPLFMDAVESALQKIITASDDVCLIFGAPRRQNGKLYNAVFLCQHARLLGVYDKHFLPNYGVFDERRYFEPGQSSPFFSVNGKSIAVGVCEDLWHDDWANELAHETCDVWLNLNASPFHVDKQQQRESLTARRSRQFAAPLAYVNMVGGQDEVVFDGGSHVVGAQGELAQRAPLFEAATMVLSLDKPMAEIIPVREPIAQIYQALVLGIRDYVLRNGCKQVVLGLSGGIDSAITAVLAVDALGAEHVLGVLLPSCYSSKHSIDDARALVDALAIESITLPIASSVEAVEAALADTFAAWDKSKTDVTEENIQARIRGVLLMAISNKTGRMLLTTGNKSEMAVGYATLYGDMAGGFAVLKDVYKTEVFALAAYINRETIRIPQNTIDKPPSAELRPDQKDSDSLPDYDVLDAILRASIEQRMSVPDIVALGYDGQEVKRVVRLLQLSEYKRRQSPPGVKITERAFGRDRRYPITHGFWEV